MADIPIRLIVQQVNGAIPAALAQQLRGLSQTALSAARDIAIVGSAVSVAMTAVVASTVGAAAKWESAFAGVRKTVDGDLSKIETGLRRMATEIPMAAEELAGIAESAGQLGVANENILEFTETVAKLAVTTNLSAEQASNDMARFFNITASGKETFAQMGSAIVWLGNKSAATEQEILAMSNRLAKAGETAGMSRPEIMAMATALSDVGIKAEAGGSSAARILITIQEAARSGGDKLKEFARVTNMLPEAFQKLAMTKPADAVQAFADGLAKIKAEGGNVFGTLKNLELGEIRVRDAALGLASAHDKLRHYTENATKAARENTAMNKEAAARFATFESQVKMLWGAVKDVAVELGMVFLPFAKQVVQTLKDGVPTIKAFAQGFAELPSWVHKSVFAIGSLITAFGAISTALAPFLFTVMSLGGGAAAIKLLTGAFNLLKGAVVGALGVLKGIAAFLATGFGAVVGATTAIGAYAISLSKDIEEARANQLKAEVVITKNEEFARRMNAFNNSAANKTMQGAFSGLREALDVLHKRLSVPLPEPAGVDEAAEKFKAFAKSLDGSELREKLADYGKALASGIKFTPSALKELSDTFDKAVADGLKITDKGVIDAAAKYRAAETAKSMAKWMAEAMADLPALADPFKGLKVGDGLAQQMAREIADFEKQMDALNKSFDRGEISVDAYIAALEGTIYALDEYEKRMLRLEVWSEKWLDIASVVGDVGEVLSEMGVSGGTALQAISSGLEKGTQAGRAYAQATTNFAKAAVIANTALYALKNGALAGAAAGAQLGFEMGGPLGAALGAAGGALLGWIGKAARAREEARRLAAEISKNRTAYIAAAGGLDVLSAKAQSVGLSLERLFNAKTVQEYEAAVNELNTAFDLQKQANDALTAAMEKYGISIDQLGPKFRQQRLDEMALDLLRDFELLKAAGVDMTVIIEKMGPAFQEYVNKVVQGGGTIPEALRPAIEEMIKMGLLLDASGNKITDISQLKFAESLEAGVKSLIDSIYDLIAALTGIPREVNSTINVTRRTTEEGGGGGGGGGEGGETRAAYGAYVPARPGGQRFVVGEGGSDEVIAPVKAILTHIGAGLAAQGGGGDNQPIVIYLNNDKVVESTIGELKRRSSGGQKILNRRGVTARG